MARLNKPDNCRQSVPKKVRLQRCKYSLYPKFDHGIISRSSSELDITKNQDITLIDSEWLIGNIGTITEGYQKFRRSGRSQNLLW